MTQMLHLAAWQRARKLSGDWAPNVLLRASVALWLAGGLGAGGAQANQCASQGNNKYICSGNLGQGFDVNALVDAGTAQVITVENLDGDIAPTGTSGSGGGNGVVWYKTGQQATLNLADSNHRIYIDATDYSAVHDRYAVVLGPGTGTSLPGSFHVNIAMPIEARVTNRPAVYTWAVASNGGTGKNGSGGDGGLGQSVGGVSVTGSAAVTALGNFAPALDISLLAGAGGPGGANYDPTGGAGGSGGIGGIVGTVSINSSGSTPWQLHTTGDQSPGIRVAIKAGDGGRGGSGGYNGGEGQDGGNGGAINVGVGSAGPAQFSITNSQPDRSQSPAITLQSNAGNGGRGYGGGLGNGGNAGDGGAGGKVTVNLTGSTLSTVQGQSPGVVAVSQGGNGGGGGVAGTSSDGGDGGIGLGGSTVSVNASGVNTITTTGDESDGIEAYSLGGIGGTGGDGSVFGPSGNGGVTGDSGHVGVTTSSSTTINTSGYNSHGIVAQSIAGHGGGSGNEYGLVEFHTEGGSAGAGGTITITNGASITSKGNASVAISALSSGGGGGRGGSSFGAFYAKGGTGGQGGAGETVTVGNTGTLTTSGNNAAGIVAQSIGGVGGSGGSAGAIVGIGGKGGATSPGGNVTVTNSGQISTGVGTPSGAPSATDGCPSGCSQGILAQSIGGGGGAGGSSGGWFTFGGSAGGGGTGGTVTVNHSSSEIDTSQDSSPAIAAQSIGGGGGHGGAVVGVGAEISAAVGGSGGNGGSGNTVLVEFLDAASLETQGAQSYGIAAQSIGGGGGSGGFSVDVALGAPAPALSFAMGGSGGGGGEGGYVTVDTLGPNGDSPAGTIKTAGDHATGILAQSIGGGGGHGGLAVAVGVSDVSAFSVGIGGKGGSGGKSHTVTVNTNAGITTTGDHADGILAQSIGGGGGHGGTSASVAVSTGASVAVGFGGRGGAGGIGDPVVVKSLGDLAITTEGDFSYGVLAQAIGGGGGKGGTAISGSIAVTGEEGGAALSFGFGGSGAVGGYADSVDVEVDNPVRTYGQHSPGITAQSIAGGGGAGGTAISASVSGENSVGIDFGLGGSGGAGANASLAQVQGSGGVTTGGDHAPGIVVQSIAGGGGSGGMAISGGVTLSSSTSLDLAIGGQGGKGGTAGSAIVTRPAGDISTQGLLSDGVLAQSIGGGGGNGGAALTGNMGTSESTSVGVSIGGGTKTALSGGVASTVTVQTGGAITATGDGSRGVVAQSIGGGGGSGGAALSGSLVTSNTSKALSVAVGGHGGEGGNGGTVNVTTTGAVTTGTAATAANGLTGEHGILAQSIGGGGGSGGFAADGTANVGNRSLQVTVGGFGGTGASGSAVTVTNTGGVTTHGYQSHGVLAQSIGGGGGDGGGTATFGVTTKSAKAYSVSVGGLGGGGAGTGHVTVNNDAAITATGLGSRGIVAQTIAGGGGTGGSNLFKNQSGSNDPDQFSLGVGGFGGSGASPAGVTLTTTAASVITTGSSDGSSAALPDTVSNYAGHGVLLQGIGGGGGDGSAGIQGDVKPGTGGGDSTKSADIAIGGFGGGGGNGGVITAGTTSDPLRGSITTWNYNSNGILAQSIGGGGGSGGAGIQGDVKNNASEGLTIGIGGFGKGAGSGRTIGIVSAADIRVAGDNSKGILAQSIGGGGGAGGTGITGDVSGASDDDTKQLTFGLGGRGAGGGTGGAVSLTNSGKVTTGASGSGSSTVMGMDALAAQSIGGGGGAGGVAIAGSITNSTKSEATSVTLGIALGAGGGGSGGRVQVTNSGTLDTMGNQARGILAQSIGGGGGTGGVGIAGNVKAPSGATSANQLDLGLGGKAGGGGGGGQVTVANTGNITTAYAANGSSSDQNGMHGILAQSIGGGGGAGGIGVGGNVTGSDSSNTLNISVGGAGGSGGVGFMGSISDDVTTAGVGVSNSAVITAVGGGSLGILAQNIGGGGGDASALLNGTVSSGAKDSNDDSDSDGDTLTIAIGNKGGSGGAGGTVHVANTGTVTTGTVANIANPKVRQAHGIQAQSVGGGGGNGKLSAGIVFGDTTNTGYQHGVKTTLGGVAGGGSGAAVRVDNTSDGFVITHDMHSYAILAQSIGGGGGHGADAGGIGTQNPSSRWLLDVNLGAGASAGKEGGDGGAVTVNNAGTVSTYGDGSVGIFAQSVGGGGGVAGDGAGAKQQVQNSVANTLNAVVSLNVGATNGSNGNGSAVTVTHDGSITTRGNDAVGIIAQSVGGGGGRGGSAVAGRSGIVTVGGTGNAYGNAGAVKVTGSGSITTGKTRSGGRANQAISVSQAHGILAQSIGGGGGHAGTTRLSDSSRFGSKLNMADEKNNSGTGGAVTVDFDGPITTAGDSSVGILAQSVGGGGGIAGEVTQTVTGALVGSLGGDGTAGPVTITLGNSGGSSTGITTSGDSAHGIFAQSAGGGGTTTTTDTMVSVTVGADVTVSGGGAHGIYAQSVGDGMGAIKVTVEQGATVQGGGAAVDDGADDGAGIFIQDGTSATIANAGTITSVLGTDGVAIHVVDTNVNLDNSGTITGQILKASSINLVNYPGGLINAGPLLDVDTLNNQGTLAPGGAGRIATTRLTGDLVQSSSGVLAVDLDANGAGGSAQADQLSVGGRAQLDGRIAVNPIDPWQPSTGLQSVRVLSSDGELSWQGLEVFPSAVAQYRLLMPAPRAVHLGYDIDFANAGILDATNDNQDDIARHVHGIYRAQALDESVARELIAIEDTASYATAMNSLGAEIVVDNQIASLLAGIRFNDVLLSCAERGGDYRFLDQGQCGWLRLGGQRFEHQETGDNLGFDEDSWQIAGGGQVDIGGGWSVGGALSYESSNLDADDSRASSNGDRFQLGLSVKRRFDATELSGSLAVGYGHFDIDRAPWPSVNIDGTQKLWLYSAQLRAAHLFDVRGWHIKPRLDLGIDYLSMGDFNESGGSGFSIHHQGQDNTYVYIQPAVDITTEIETETGTLVRPRLTLGITQFLGNAAAESQGRFAVAPATVPTFTVSTDLDRTRLDVAAGVDVLTRDILAVRAELFGSFSDNSEIYGGGLTVAIPF